VRCAPGALVLARIDRLVYGAADPRPGPSAQSSHRRGAPLNHRVPSVQGGVLADECGELLRAFFARKAQPREPSDATSALRARAAQHIARRRVWEGESMPIRRLTTRRLVRRTAAPLHCPASAWRLAPRSGHLKTLWPELVESDIVRTPYVGPGRRRACGLPFAPRECE